MFSTPADLAQFCQCLLRDGRLGDVRVWAPTTVLLATTNRMDDYPDLPEPLRRTKRWGLGWQMNGVDSRNAFSELLDRDVFGHTGATGTMLWIDRKLDAFCILLTTGVRAKAPWRLVRLSNVIAAAFR
jgi:CubicO group peptidase (beta-lactamase class C family)